MASSAPILDLWAPLSHKGPLADDRPSSVGVPTWVSVRDQRRLAAYRVLAAYRLNCARNFLPAWVAQEDREKRREYGDPDLLVDRIRAGVLGEDPEIVVEGADVDLPDEPDLPEPPVQPDPDADPIVKRVYEIRKARWEQQATETVDAWEQAWADLPGLVERQEWLRRWADAEGYWAKVHEGEGDTVGLGDGVYVLTWTEAKKRWTLSVYDPGMYFPVIDDDTADLDYPTRVHLAWEFEDDNQKRFVRRKTWWLGPIVPTVDDDGEPTGFAVDGDRFGAGGQVVRDYPWNVDEQGAQVESATTCYFSDRTWEIGDVDSLTGLADLDESKGIPAVTEDGTPAVAVDLGIDWLPVVHVPNTPTSREHFGASALLVIAQLLDDIAASDTDVQAASALAAGPMVALFGAGSGDSVQVQPGTAFKLPKDGKMDVLDLSAGLEQLRQVNEGLRDLMSVNGRVPGEVMGRVDSTQDRSGISIALGMSPYGQMIAAMRMTRAKHSLLLKFVQRGGQLAGQLPSGRNPTARIAFGPFLPTDGAAVVTQVTDLLNAGAISTQTGVQMLVAAGFTIDDAKGEVDRIRAGQTDKARELADATGSEQLAAEWLGVDLPDPATAPAPATTAPTLTLPPTGATDEGE